MAWLFLLIAGLCEPAWAIGLKYTEGFYGGQYWIPRPCS